MVNWIVHSSIWTVKMWQVESIRTGKRQTVTRYSLSVSDKLLAMWQHEMEDPQVIKASCLYYP